jgi:hypothetical protein
MRGDYVDKFKANGPELKRLIERRTWFRDAAYPYEAQRLRRALNFRQARFRRRMGDFE